MKLDKKKITFGVVIGIVLIFITGYSLLIFGNYDDNQKELIQPLVPELETEQEEYTSKLDALNDLKEVRQTNAPSIYDEKLLDSNGVFDPDLLEKEKMRIVDSIYKNGRINYTEKTYRNSKSGSNKISTTQDKTKLKTSILPPKPIIEEMVLEQQLFFASNPKGSEILQDRLVTHALVDDKQTIKANDRLEMRTLKDFFNGEVLIPRNTVLYGIVSFRPNRVLLKIENINHQPIPLKAFDFQDGLEGIYIKNSFRADASKEIVDDTVGDINIPGVPQVRGIKKVFRRSNRHIKVTIHNNYKLILKSEL